MSSFPGEYGAEQNELAMFEIRYAEDTCENEINQNLVDTRMTEEISAFDSVLLISVNIGKTSIYKSHEPK